MGRSKYRVRLPTAPPGKIHKTSDRKKNRSLEENYFDEVGIPSSAMCECGHDHGWHPDGFICMYEIENDIWCDCEKFRRT